MVKNMNGANFVALEEVKDLQQANTYEVTPQITKTKPGYCDCGTEVHTYRRVMTYRNVFVQ